MMSCLECDNDIYHIPLNYCANTHFEKVSNQDKLQLIYKSLTISTLISGSHFTGGLYWK